MKVEELVKLMVRIPGLEEDAVNDKRNAACDFINNENGFICELSEWDVAEKMFMALDGRRDVERKCIENARKYDWERIIDLVEYFYKAGRDHDC